MDDEEKAAGVDLCTESSSSKEVSSSAEIEAVEDAGHSPCPFSESEDEGVSRSAEVSAGRVFCTARQTT